MTDTTSHRDTKTEFGAIAVLLTGIANDDNTSTPDRNRAGRLLEMMNLPAPATSSSPVTSASPMVVHDEIRARRLVIVDGQGQEQIRLEVMIGDVAQVTVGNGIDNVCICGGEDDMPAELSVNRDEIGGRGSRTSIRPDEIRARELVLRNDELEGIPSTLTESEVHTRRLIVEDADGDAGRAVVVEPGYLAVIGAHHEGATPEDMNTTAIALTAEDDVLDVTLLRRGNSVGHFWWVEGSDPEVRVGDEDGGTDYPHAELTPTGVRSSVDDR